MAVQTYMNLSSRSDGLSSDEDEWENALETPEQIDLCGLEKALSDFRKGLDGIKESKTLFTRWKTHLLEKYKTISAARKPGAILDAKEIHRHKGILEVRILRVFQETERYGKDVADAIRGVIVAEEADDIEDSVIELRWEMMQAKRLMEPLDEAKEGYESLKSKITEMSEKGGMDMSLLNQMISDDTVEQIISSLDDVSKHLNEVSSNMQGLKGRNISPQKLNLLLNLQGEIEEITTNQDIHDIFFKKRSVM